MAACEAAGALQTTRCSATCHTASRPSLSPPSEASSRPSGEKASACSPPRWKDRRRAGTAPSAPAGGAASAASTDGQDQTAMASLTPGAAC